VSKAGLEALTRVMAFELAPAGVRVNAMSPGTIATEFLAAMLTPDARAARERRIPTGRLGTPEEVADVIAFLVSSDSRYVTGSAIAIDGGLLFAGIRT
jgi:NAD(P)-dependent dehydrogenase (short-subunit alcohol dehydrogenase family)